ncbi:MAG: AsnC family protein [Acidiphilium sp.]|nr:AsnC family protein [Acidiphilium sp.]MDD4934612.1 AsnC family protein [Acidiphilium sp.]
MPMRRDWTESADNTIRRMRADGATWAAIGDMLGLSRNTIIERGRRIHAAGGPSQAPRPPRPPEEDPNRGPLRAGHPISWGILTAGTVLEGTAFVPLSADRWEYGR